MGYRFVVVVLLSLGALHPQVAEAAGETACTGYVDSLPLAIDKPGVWCLRRNIVASAKPGGAALFVRADDVTLDCRGFRIEASLLARRHDVLGIVAVDRNNVVVRNCGIRGFWIGIVLNNGRGHIVERNLLEDNTFMGIFLPARASLIQHNRIIDTGGDDGSLIAVGAYSAGADVLDNTVDGLLSPGAPRFSGTNAALLGIYVHPDTAVVSGNRVRQTGLEGTDLLYGIFATHFVERINIHHNDLIGPGGQGIGVECYTSTSLVTNNRINGFAIPVRPGCTQTQNRVAP